MPIKFRTQQGATSSSVSSIESISSSSPTPIDRDRNWSVSPGSNPIIWQEGTPYPSDKTIKVTYPSEDVLRPLHEGKTYEKYVYSFDLEPSGFYDIETNQDYMDVKLDKDGAFKLLIKYKSMQSLPVDDFHSKKITFFVHGYTSFLEGDYHLELISSKEYPINLKRLPKADDPTMQVPEALFIVYNKNTDELTGQVSVDLKTEKAGITVNFEVSNPLLSLSTVENGIYKILKIESINDAPANGEMIIYSIITKVGGSVVGITKVHLKIIDVNNTFVSNNFRLDYNFCLDKRRILAVKSNELADRVHMRLTMAFEYSNKPSYEVTQTYEYVYFDNKLTIDAGEEIHDFFDKMSTKFLHPEMISISDETQVIKVNSIFKCCSVDIELTETNQKGEVFNSTVYRNTKWMPGKFPLAFPYLTQGRKRRTYTDSILSICSVAKNYHSGELNKIVGTTDNSEISTEWDVVQILAKRQYLKGSMAQLDIINHASLWLEPAPNPDGVINVIFENQNKVPDWFSFTDVYEIQPEFEFNITQNISTGLERKTDVTKKETIKLNTGWFRSSEFELLNDLMSSSLCYIKIDNKWLRALPISKKPLAYNSVERLHQQYVEFQIVSNER